MTDHFKGVCLSRLDQPLVQIGTAPADGTRILSPQETAQLFNNPGFYEAANLAREHGEQFRHRDGRRRNSAAHELLEKASKAAKLHAQEQERAAALRAKKERSHELAQYL